MNSSETQQKTDCVSLCVCVSISCVDVYHSHYLYWNKVRFISLSLCPFHISISTFFYPHQQFHLFHTSSIPIRSTPTSASNGTPQVEEPLPAEDLDMTKTGGEGVSQTPDEPFTDEYITSDFGMKEYDYSYKDYNEPISETKAEDTFGPALSAVTDEGGVSNPMLSGKFPVRLWKKLKLNLLQLYREHLQKFWEGTCLE